MSDDTKKAPESIQSYVREMRETGDLLLWVWREFVDDESKKRAKTLLFFLSVTLLAVNLQPLSLSFAMEAAQTLNVRSLVVSLGALLILYLVNQMASFKFERVREWIINRNYLHIDEKVNRLFYEKTLGQHISQGHILNYSSIEQGRNRLRDVHGMFLFEANDMLVSMTLAYALLWYLSPVVGLVMTGLLLVHLAWTVYLNYYVALEMAPIEEEWRIQRRQFVERWEKISRVKTSGKGFFEHKRLIAWFNNILMADWKFWSWYILQSRFREASSAVVGFGILVYGSFMVWDGSWQAGTLLPLSAWVGNIVQKLWYLGHLERRLNDHIPRFRSMKKALGITPSFVEGAGVPIATEEPVPIVFKGVDLSYQHGEKRLQILRGIDFQINPGEKVALVGPSGSGKTTIMKLLLRFMDPDSGEIWVNGHKLRDLDLSSWMEHVGYIPQQPVVFDHTLRYNLTFGLSEERQTSITDEEIWEVMQLLQIDFGERLTEGLETRVGKDGMKLSGGQAQRLMIGAAVIKKPIFMVVDEATSSLDRDTEKLVQKGLEKVLAGPVGALIVAHRLATVRSICNRFLVLRPIEECNGGSQIEAEAGSFEELYEVSPTFRRLADD